MFFGFMFFLSMYFSITKVNHTPGDLTDISAKQVSLDIGHAGQAVNSHLCELHCGVVYFGVWQCPVLKFSMLYDVLTAYVVSASYRTVAQASDSTGIR